MSRAQRAAFVQDTYANRVKLEWPFNKNDELGPVPHKKRILKAVTNIKSSDFKKFQEDVNDLVHITMKQTSPMHLRFGGFVIAVLLAILGVVCLSLEEFAVGTVVVILAVMVAGMGFWYRSQLVDRAWKKIGQGLTGVFKDFASRIPGISCEFHVKGTHTLNRKHRNDKKKKGDRAVFFDRYIILYLPGDAKHFHEYTEDRRTTTQIVKGNSTAVNERHDYVDDAPLILPYWWAMKKDPKTGKKYFINNLKHETSWDPPTTEQIAMEREELGEILSPPADDSDEESS